MKTFLQLIGAMMLTGLIIACKGPEGAVGPAGAIGPTGPQGAPGPTGPNLTGSIGGYARLYDGVSALKNRHSGVVVSLKGTTPLISDTTNVDGYFELKNVRTGSYNLEFSKAEHNPYTFVYSQHIGGAALNLINRSETAVRLYERPSYTFTTLTVSQTFTTGINLRATPDATVGTREKNVAYYWGLDPNITYATAPYRYIPRTNGFPDSFYGSSPETFLTYTPGFTNSIGVAKGQRVHIYAVPIAPGFELNPLTNAAGGTVLTGTKPSPSLIITVP